jgi:hypothetical protein
MDVYILKNLPKVVLGQIHHHLLHLPKDAVSLVVIVRVALPGMFVMPMFVRFLAQLVLPDQETVDVFLLVQIYLFHILKIPVL